MKVIVITGSASGIGRHLTGALAKDGNKIMATDINIAGLKKVAREDKWGKEVLLERLDIRSEKSWKNAITKVIKKFGKLDLLINNAGYLLPGYISDLTEDIVARHLDINARGMILGTSAATRIMKKQHEGQIINIASLAGVAGIPGISVYSASKHAARGFSLAASQELSDFGIHVTVICPDPVQTPMLDLQKDYKESAMTFSGGKYLTPSDIEGAVRRAIDKKPREILIPSGRGFLAKFASAFPSLSASVASVLIKQGLKHQEKFRKSK